MSAAEAKPLALPVLLSRISGAVGAVHKGDRNASQGFNFRGVDAVVNAVHPHLTAHGVTIRPIAVEVTRATVEVGQRRTPMGHVSVIVTYRFTGPAGDDMDCQVAGEAMDSGDKATPKAMSVAYRTALLQALSLPTDEADPDHESYQRSEPDAMTPEQEAAAKDYADAITAADSLDSLRDLYTDMGRSHLPDAVKAALARDITARREALPPEEDAT